MVQVFKCDYCSHTSSDSTRMSVHEAGCSFNPICKTCHTCKYSFEDGYTMGGHSPGCEIGLDVIIGEDLGDCKGWERD